MVSVGSEAVPIVVIACKVLLVWMSSKIKYSDVSVLSVERRNERDFRVAGLNVPSSVCEGASVPVAGDEAEDEADVDAGTDADVGTDADIDDDAEVEVDVEVEVEVEVEEGGLPIAAAFVVIRAPPLVTTTPVAALLPELAVQLKVSTLVRLK